MSVQTYETDALQEHIDSTSILISRLDQWRHSVYTVQQYIQGYYQVHQSETSNLERTLKNINDVPTFGGIGQTTEGSNTPQLATVFKDMQQNVNLLLQRSVATTNGIKTSVLPSLDTVAADIEKHYKSLRSQGSKGIKEVEKCREHTQKLVEQLGQVTSSYGARSLSTSEDPLVLHRKVSAAVAEQVARENTQAEAALNVQQSFKSLENHVITTIRQSLNHLATLNEGFDKSEYEVNTTITNLFKDIDMNQEWTTFTKANSENLVPNQNYLRDPKYVTFVNKDHASTKPVLEGSLNRKGTVLKSYNQGYYVISPTGYMYQFKNAEPTLDSTPELSLYLPNCQVSKSSRVGENVFKIVGKDSHKAISTRHKYVFKAGSPQELEAWFAAVSRMTGNVVTDEDSGEGDLNSPATTEPSSPVQPPTSQMANTSIDQRTAATPAAAANFEQPQQFQQVPQQTPQQVPQLQQPQPPSHAQAAAAQATSQAASPQVPSASQFASSSQAAPAYTPAAATQESSSLPWNQAQPSSAAQQAVPQVPSHSVPQPQSQAAGTGAVQDSIHNVAHSGASAGETDPFKGF